MKIVNYKCPNCAGPMRFEIDPQQWVCRYCDSAFSATELDRLLAQVGTEVPERDEVPAYEFDEKDTAVYICPDCGGRIITAINTAATFCVYCHNPVVVADHLKGEHAPVRILPFKLKKEVFMEELRAICRKKPLLPGTFRHYVRRGEVTGLYVPFWLFSASIYVSVIGTARKVGRLDRAGHKYELTDHYQIVRSATVPFENVPVDASLRMDNELMDALEPYDFTQLEDFSMQYLSGFFAESFDEDATDCTLRFIERTDKAVRTIMADSIKGYTVSDLETVDVRRHDMHHEYVMLPVWVMNVKEGKETYTFLMNAQTGKVAGHLPVSARRVGMLFMGFLILLIILTVLFGRFVL